MRLAHSSNTSGLALAGLDLQSCLLAVSASSVLFPVRGGLFFIGNRQENLSG